jgi:hypothetical protein
MRRVRDVTIGVRVSNAERELLKRLARANDLTVATAMRREALQAARRLPREESAGRERESAAT